MIPEKLGKCRLLIVVSGVAAKTPAKKPKDDVRRLDQQKENNKSISTIRKNGLLVRTDKQRGHGRRHAGFNKRWDSMSKDEQIANGANKRSVWTVATKPYKGSHFATFPSELITDCIKAGCMLGGIVLDPFFGSGTTGYTALDLGRSFIGIETDEANCRPLIEQRFSGFGLFNPLKK